MDVANNPKRLSVRGCVTVTVVVPGYDQAAPGVAAVDV
jgi:hypothetical protein